MGRTISATAARVSILSAVLAAVGGSAVRAATILDFEGGGADGGEGLVNTNYTIATFGATHGMYADDIVNTGPSATLFDIGTVTGGSTGPALNHFNAINAGLNETAPTQISFDVSLDTTNVTSDGYYQLTLIGNSQNGYWQLGYGNFINGYNIKSGFSLGGLATTEGVTLTAVTAFTNGIGTYHVTVPLFPQAANSDGSHPTYGDGAGGANSSYYQFSLVGSGGYGGTATFAVDNVQIGTSLTPEPASLALLAFGASTLKRRRQSAEKR